MTTLEPTAHHTALAELQVDADPVVRAVGAAIGRAIADDLDPGERGWVAAIEDLRAEMEASDEEIDTAFANRRGVRSPTTVGEVALRRSKKGVWALLLMVLARELRPRRILELGSCLGISGAYLAAAAQLNGQGTLTTLEGSPALALRAQENLQDLGLTETYVIPGRFRDTLQAALDRWAPIDLVFIDGHHDEEATQAYFAWMLARLTEPAVVVFDDIAWSDGMVRAWQALRSHPSVRVAVDLERVGVCVVGAGQGSRQVDLPALSKMAAQAQRDRR